MSSEQDSTQVSEARRQRKWLEAHDATKEAEANLVKAQQDLDSAAHHENATEKALFNDSDV